MNDVLDILRLITPTLVAALPTWGTLRLLLGRRSSIEGLSKGERWGRLALVFGLFALYGALAVVLLELVWPGGETVGQWMISMLPILAVSLFAVAGLEGGGKEKPKVDV